MTIHGLESDGYFIDNPILLTITDTRTDVYYVEVTIQNESNLKSVNPFRLYAQNQLVKFKADSIVKGLFDIPKHNVDYLATTPLLMPRNANTFKFSFRTFYTNGDVSTINNESRVFIRGGLYDTRLTNETVSIGALLQNAERVPVFGGYPCAYYITENKHNIVKYNRISVNLNSEIWELMRKKTCDGAYIKFLNSFGGYSYWLFEDWKDLTSNKHLGVASSFGGTTDLGSEVDFEFEAMSKVPRRYIGLIKDLIVSKEVYIYLNNGKRDELAWRRLWLKDNKIEEKRKSNAYNVAIKFTEEKNYNPSLLWAN